MKILKDAAATPHFLCDRSDDLSSCNYRADLHRVMVT
jgi:hypothetical protein